MFSRSVVQLFATPWAVARQAPLSLEFSRQEYWSGLPCSPPGDLLNAGTEPRSLALQADSFPSEPPALGQEDPLEKGMATLSSILVWRIPRTEEPGGLQSMGWEGVRHE